MAEQITPLPEAPSRSDDSTTFTTKADAFLGALDQFGNEINDVANDVESNADTATVQALAASASASVAAASANATLFNAATAYVQGQAAISLLDYKVYRRKSAGTSSTDPKLDGTNWAISIDTLTQAQAVAISLYF